MRWLPILSGAGAAALGVRVLHARHERILHPDGRSFDGELQVWGPDGEPTGANLIDTPGRHPVTARVSKGAGTPRHWPDLFGLAVRVHGPVAGAKVDLLLSTAGRGRLSRHVPTPRWGFDTHYGSILAYRTGSEPPRKIYLAAVPDPDGPALGRTLESVVAATRHGGARLLLALLDADGGLRPFGRLVIDTALPAEADAALAFDPVRNTTPDLHPTGLVHASRAAAYRLAQQWRGATPAPADPDAVTRTAAHR